MEEEEDSTNDDDDDGNGGGADEVTITVPGAPGIVERYADDGIVVARTAVDVPTLACSNVILRSTGFDVLIGPGVPRMINGQFAIGVIIVPPSTVCIVVVVEPLAEIATGIIIFPGANLINTDGLTCIRPVVLTGTLVLFALVTKRNGKPDV
ncbi:hypothetical protein BLOT_008031 [Blomia tropicalis]|nr:hypothetical protein BLOT_008031 [Blomia tropicalis]